MKGQPERSDGIPEPYDAIAEAYDRLDDWIIENWGEKTRPERTDFLRRLWAGQPVPVRAVLEVCCGTGLMLEQLALRGLEVAGLDRSPAMLRQASKRLGADASLILAELPAIPTDRRFDAVFSSGCGLNYTSCEADLTATFCSVARVLRPAGTFVFDVLGRPMMDEHNGSALWAADLGDLAFIWEFRNLAGYCDATYTQFLRRENGPVGCYDKAVETHRLYPLGPDMIRRAAGAAGFVGPRVYDNYTDLPAHDATLYETWVLTRADGVARG